jgi:hypothetical protein
MKKTFLRKLALGFSILTFCTYGIIYACSDDGDWGWTFDSNFTPETFVDKSYSPLFLSQDIFYTGFDTEHNSRFNDEIVQDWTTFLKGKMDDKTVKFFLIDSSATVVSQLQNFYTSNKNNPISVKWSKKIDLKDRKISSFITFLALSKQIETASVGDGNNWSYDPIPQKTFNNPKLIKTIENRYNTVSDAFLKNRYWFQTVKAYFYSGDKQNTVAFFQKTENTVPKNTLYYRALAYIAGTNYKNKKYALSNYQYSQVFDNCPAMRVVVAYCFHPQEESDWNQSLVMTKNNNEKAALWAIHGYFGNEQKAIEKIIELKPESDHLDFLLTRLINNQEVKISKDFSKSSVIENKKTVKDSVNQSVLKLVSKIAESDKIAKPYLWNIAAGYLETLNGNFAQADKYFSTAETKMPKKTLAINQLRLLRFVNNLSKIDKIDVNNEKTILKDLSWLYAELPKTNDEIFRYQNASSWSKSYLSALYKYQNNNVMSELFVRDNNFYDNGNNLQEMKAFLSKNDKSAIEKIGVGIYTVRLNDINDYQAVLAAYANKIPEAILFMQQADSIQNIKFYGNPFNGNIKDCHDCEQAAFQKKKYSQLDFLNTIKIMQDNAAKGDDVYANSLLLGNAFYNITHFGNARLFYETNIIGSGSSPYYFKDKIREMITDCSLAKMYYQKAFEAAKTREQKAKCIYLLTKCERNEYYNKQYNPSKDSWENQFEVERSPINFLAWNGFKELKNKYSDTKYYQDVINECGYFKTYLSQK